MMVGIGYPGKMNTGDHELDGALEQVCCRLLPKLGLHLVYLRAFVVGQVGGEMRQLERG
jgi:hypothetical protein